MGVTTRHARDGVILVVDDQRIVLQAIQRVLESHGFRTMGVSSGWGAIEVLKSDTPVSCMLVDVILGDVSGTEVLEKARSLRPALPLIAMSGYGDYVPGLDKQPAADGYLSKPFDMVELVATITRLTERRPDPPRLDPAKGTKPDDALGD